MKKISSTFFMCFFLTILAVPIVSAQNNVSIWNGSSEIWTQGQGTQSSPYQIENAQQLAFIAEMVNGGVTHYDNTYFKLTTDVYIDSLTIWQPIGLNGSNYFGGHFDGDSHTVTLYLTASTLYVGIFGYAKNGSFQNLTSAGQVTCTSASSSANTGGICGYSSSPFTNCHNTGNISSLSGSSGGICGYSNSTFLNCHNTGNISSLSRSSGGICGHSMASFTNCHNTGNISSYSSSGGICGSVENDYGWSINTQYCSNTGNISASNGDSGGILGRVTAGCSCTFTMNVTNCHNHGNILSSGYAGGICGYVRIFKSNGNNRSACNVTYCYNIASVSSNIAGGICGYLENITYDGLVTAARYYIKNCYNVGLLSGSQRGGICGGTNPLRGYTGYSSLFFILNCFYLNTCEDNAGFGTAKTEAQMKSSSFPVLLNADSVVFVMDITPNINQGYPVFGSVSTQDASNVGATVATLNGRYQMLYNVDAHGFEYKTNSESNYTMVNSTGDSPVSYTVSGLQGGTPYSYRFFVQKDGVIYRGADKTFTTAVCSLAVQVTATPAKLCEGDTVLYTAVPTGGTGCQYSWSTGSQNSSIGITTDATYTVTVTDDLGCQVTASKQLTMYPAAVASISGSTVLCNNGSTTLTANGGTTYLWSTGSSQRTISVSQPGTYITTVTTVYGCTASDTVEVVPFANPSILGETSFCTDGYTTLTATGGDSYQWSTGATSASIHVNTPGNYSVTASTTSGCSGSSTVNVMQNQPVNVTITGNSIVCSGTGTTLTATSGTSYLWSSGETTQSINVSTAGDYSVTVTNSNGCSGTSTKTVTMMEPVVISGNNHICEGENTTLYVSGTGSYTWSNEAHTSSIIVSTPGNYSVTASLPNGCFSTASVNLTVASVPVAAITGNTTFCQGQSSTLTATGGNSYMWSNASTNNNINVSQSGVYTVTATNAEGCSATANVTVTVNPLPNVNISGNNSFCQGDNVTLTATGASSYAWSNGSSTAATTVTNQGVYTVIGTDANGCSATASKTVSVNPTYQIHQTQSICQGETYNFNGQYLTAAGTYTQNLSTINGCDSTVILTLSIKSLSTPTILGNTTFCQGQTSTLTANGGNSYVWSNASTGNSIIVNQSGIYTVTATNAEGCSATANVTVTVNPLPNVNINGNNSFCQGDNVTLTASGANTYAWSNTTSNAAITVSSAGTYTVTGTDANGCSSIATKTVSVNPTYNIPLTHSICQGESYNFYGQNLSTAGTYTHTLQTVNGCDSVLTLTFTVKSLPTPSITGNTTFCQGQSTTLTATGGNSYVWSNASTSNNISVSQSGVYTVTATNVQGCSATANVTVTVNPLPNVNISGNNSFCQGDNVTLTASGANSYAWSNATSNAATTVSSAGIYTVTGTDANGCSSIATKTVAVNPTYNIPITHSICQGESYNFYGQNLTTAGTYTHTLQTVNGCDSVLTLTFTVKSLPTPTITGNTTVCQGQTSTLTATGGNSYVWSNAGTGNSISVSQSGVYTVTATNAQGCSATANVTVTVNPLPNVTISGNSTICQGSSTTLTASGANTYVWSNTSSNAAITVSSAGTYTVTGTDANGCSSIATKTVAVNPTYNIPLTHSICQGESYNFYGQNLTTAGTYTHTLQTVNGCDSVLTLTFTVKSLPTPTITGNTSLCVGENTTLTVSGGNSYVWSNAGTGNSISVSQSGVYTVTATNAQGCSATANVTVTVNSLPMVTISGNSTICQGSSTTLTASGANTYAWSNATSNPAITVSSAGTYTVTGTDANGCSSIATKTVSVNPTYNVPLTHSICQGESYNFYGQNLTTSGIYTHTLQTVNGCDSVLTLTFTVKSLPTPTITGNTSLCVGENTTLTVSGGNSYVWSNASTSNNINVSQSGVYTVTATNVEGCTATANVTVTVNPLPTVTINGNSTICQGNSTTLTASGANTYAWSNTSSSVAITVNSAGTYTVTGTDANGCSGTATKTVSVNPTYNIPLTHSICQGESYNFYGQNLTTAGTYTHTLQTVNGCDSVLTLTFTIKPVPTPSISGNTTLCQGQSTTLTANGGVSYLWSDASTNNSINVSQSGVYTVTATNEEGCSATANVTVTVNPLPNVTISGNSTICQGSSTTLTASGANTYVWSTGDNTASATIGAFGVYTVTGTSTEGCSNTANVTVIVSQLPIITITGETDICAGESTILTANGGDSYLWSNGTTDNTLTVTMAGNYQVIGYNAAGCSSMADATVSVWQPATSEFTISCPDSCYVWNDQTYCASGDYTQTLQTVHGCDSVVTLHLTITVGIADHNTFDFKVYPNPTNGMVNVQFTNHNSPITHIQVFDIYGKLVDVVETLRATSLQTGTSAQTQIDLSRYANGVYFIKAVTDGHVVAVRKVVKQ